MSEPGGDAGRRAWTGGDGLRGRATASSVRTFVLACACVRGPSTGYLVRETYAHVIACPSWNYSSPRPRLIPGVHRTAHGPGTNGASPSGMIMHRSASHYTYTYPVYPAPILPTRYVDYTTSRVLLPVHPSRKPAQWLLCPPIALHTRIRGATRANYTYLRPIRAMHDAACKSRRERIYPVYARRENIKDIADYRGNRGKLDFQVTCDD